MAVWRIGAQSEGVEKSLHLNAPLHPNNSSASWKKRRKHARTHTPHALSFPALLRFTLYPSNCEGHTPGCHPSDCRMCLLLEVYSKKVWGFFWKVLGLMTGTPDIVPVDLAPTVVAKVTVQCG